MRAHRVAAALVALGASGAGWWLSHPVPLSACLAPVVSADEASHTVNRKLAELGKQAVAVGNDTRVPLDNRLFFECRRAGAWLDVFADPQWPAEAYEVLRYAPSFRYGRHWQQVKVQSPSLPSEAIDASARLLAQASPVAEALIQSEQCPATSAADKRALAEAGLPFVAAVAMGAGLASRETAMDTAAELLEVLRAQAGPTQCNSPVVVKQATLLTAFSDGRVPGLPCKLDRDGGGVLLRCS